MFLFLKSRFNGNGHIQICIKYTISNNDLEFESELFIVLTQHVGDLNVIFLQF